MRFVIGIFMLGLSSICLGSLSAEINEVFDTVD